MICGMLLSADGAMCTDCWDATHDAFGKELPPNQWKFKARGEPSANIKPRRWIVKFAWRVYYLIFRR
jgi:hypothetical protein